MLRAENQELRTKHELILHELEQLKRMIFGQKRERFIPEENPGQLKLELGLEETAPVEEELPKETLTYDRKKPTKKSAPTGRQPWPAHLPSVEIVIEPEGDLTGLKKIGEDRTEELDYTPASLFRRVFIRSRYVREEANGESQVLTPRLPSRPIPKGSVGPGLLAHILCEKYLDHLPLHRQMKRFARQDVHIAKSTLGEWVAATCRLLNPLYEALVIEVLLSTYLQVDETTIRVLEEMHNLAKAKKKEPPGKTHKGYFWTYFDPRERLVFFDYRSGRGGEAPQLMLKDFQGYLQTDGYSAYQSFDKKRGIHLVGCLAHVRRKFYEARSSDPDRANQALKLIQDRYLVEQKAREQGFDPAQRLALRNEEARPRWQAWQDWIIEQQQDPRVLPSSVIGKAIAYAANRHPHIARYLEDGRLEIDNNLIENQIRPIALGRKNYLFAGSEEGARRSAMIYSLLGTCQLHNINPFEWLRDVLETLPDHPINRVAELLPHRWKPNPNIPPELRAKPKLGV